jgi:hypothetical protein
LEGAQQEEKIKQYAYAKNTQNSFCALQTFVAKGLVRAQAFLKR